MSEEMAPGQQDMPKNDANTFRPRNLPNVLHTFPTLRRGNLQLRVRVVQYPKSEPLLDIREYVTGPEFNGFSKKGITLDLAQAKLLFENQELIMSALEGTY